MAMELQDLPECPVCLQSYDSSTTVPRVISCGHTVCESCLKNLPQKYPQTIRCPACTQLVKFPSPGGPSSLPKNIDLLRVTESFASEGKPKTQPQSQRDSAEAQNCNFVVPPLWSDGFYAQWRKWILPEDTVVVDAEDRGRGCFRDEKRKVSLFDVGSLNILEDGKDSVFKLSYVAKIMTSLWGMTEGEREELGLVLKVGFKKGMICEVYGFWGDLKTGLLFLVSENLNGSVLDNYLDCYEDGVSEDKGLLSSGFAIIGMEVCEAVIGMHLEGLLVGCLGPSCFQLDDFGHVKLSLTEVMGMGRMVRKGVSKLCSNGRKIRPKEMEILADTFLKEKMFVSPEMLLEVMNKAGIDTESCSFQCSTGRSSDVWSLGCTLVHFLIGKQFIHQLAEDVSECSGINSGLMDRLSSLLVCKFGKEFESYNNILCRCLNSDLENRPVLADVWKCTRGLITGTKCHNRLRLDAASPEENIRHYLAFGELCGMQSLEKLGKDREAEDSGGENQNVVEDVRVDKDFAAGLVEGKIKTKNLQGHLDCVTGLAIGGGFLFSSSFDKSIHVWSLQDFSHVHTFKGHGHKVMAIAYVDEEQPLCISVDSGGGMFLWGITNPLASEPLRKWYEQKDWRYSGIHTMAAPGNGCIYTGGGDRLIKAWTVKDGTMLCTMDGHTSVVSTLAALDGILYSGSWDGTIRLWSLCDHSLLTVLGQDMPGTVVSVLSLAVNQNMVVAACEDGEIKVWRNEVFMKSTQLHNGAIFTIGLEGKWLFSGGWDKTVKVEELSGDEFHVETRPVGSIPGSSVITTAMCWKGNLFVGYGDRNIKVYYSGN